MKRKMYDIANAEAVRRLADMNHCTPADMAKRVEVMTAKPAVPRGIGLQPADENEVQAAVERVAERCGITPAEVRERELAAHKRMSAPGTRSPDIIGRRERACATAHTANALLAGDRLRLGRVVAQVLRLAGQGKDRAEITAELLRKGVRV